MDGQFIATTPHAAAMVTDHSGSALTYSNSRKLPAMSKPTDDPKPGERQELTGAPLKTWSSYQNEVYGTFKHTPFPIDYDKLERAARKKLPSGNYNYVAGSAGAFESTAHANRAAFSDYHIIPSMLRDANKRSTQVQLFGETHHAPLLLAPVGVQGIMHPEAEEATARAAENVGIGMILSTAATRSMEKVAKANGSGQRWYQLYWPVSKHFTLSLLSRAKASGYTALVVTLDTFSLGFRPRDLEQAYLPFLKGEGCQMYFSDPVFMKKHGEDHTDTKWNGPGESPVGVEAQSRDETQKYRLLELSLAALGETSRGNFFTWEDVAFLRENWDGPLILKGIQCPEDAEKAIDSKVDGIIVSNHGGRQVNGATASLRALDRITSSPKVKNSNLTILFDSGIRTGADMVKALALGAHAVLLGRPFMWGLALGGEEGVEHVLRSLLADFEITMALSGKRCVEDLDRSMLTPNVPVYKL